jgi:hypothetical protein
MAEFLVVKCGSSFLAIGATKAGQSRRRVTAGHHARRSAFLTSELGRLHTGAPGPWAQFWCWPRQAGVTVAVRGASARAALDRPPAVAAARQTAFSCPLHPSVKGPRVGMSAASAPSVAAAVVPPVPDGAAM